MRQAISKFTNNCDICQTLKYDRQPQKLKYAITESPPKPLSIVHIDLYTINGKTILTAIDKFSRFAAGYTIPTRDCLNTTRSLRSFINTYGIPQKLIFDQGAEFSGKLFRDFCNQYNMEIHVTSFQQSSSNSPVERLHSSLTEIYRIILNKKKLENLSVDHDDILTETFITYNNSIHSATKHTPHELFTGRTHTFNKEIKLNNEHDYLQQLNAFREKLYAQVQKDTIEQKTSRTQNLNLNRAQPVETKPDDIIFRKENRRNKLTARFTKHTVLEDLGDTLITKKRQKLHKSKIKKRIHNENNDSF